ncbi:MAG: Mov34/MPN/PAD-1 family protein [Bryobacteraceae bacterium]
MRTIRVEIPRLLVERFKREAKASFPRETFAYLVGQNCGDLVVIEDLFTPDDVRNYCTEAAVNVPNHWPAEARAFAKENEAEVVGDIHSHPRSYEVWKGQITEWTPSEGDHAEGWCGLCGICVVSEQKDGRLRASVRFYGPSYRIQTRFINVC